MREDELRIVVFRTNEVEGRSITAALVGAKHRGYGNSVQEAIDDLFTTSAAQRAALALESARCAAR